MAASVRATTGLTPYQSRPSPSSWTKPTVVAGDKLLLVMWSGVPGASAASLTPPTGFTASTSNPIAARDDGSHFTGAIQVFERKCDGSEATTLSLTYSGSVSTEGRLYAIPGAADAVVRIGTPTASNQSTGDTATTLGMTTNTDGALVINAVYGWQTVTGAVPPSGYTERHQGNGSLYISDKVQTTAGATGNLSTSLPNNLQNFWGSVMIVVEAALVGVTGTMTAVEPSDTMSGAGKTGSTGTLSTTEPTDTASGTGTSGSTGTVSTTEPADTTSGAGATGSTGTLSTTEPSDTMSGAGFTGSSGTLSTTDPADTFSGSGTVTDPAPGGVTGVLNTTEAPDTFAGAGTTGSTGTLAATEAPDTFAGSGTSGSSGALSAVEPADAFAGAGRTGSTGTLSTVEPFTDTFAAFGFVGDGLPPTPASRIWKVVAEDRTTKVAAEVRVTTVQSEDRDAST